MSKEEIKVRRNRLQKTRKWTRKLKYGRNVKARTDIVQVSVDMNL